MIPLSWWFLLGCHLTCTGDGCPIFMSQFWEGHHNYHSCHCMNYMNYVNYGWSNLPIIAIHDCIKLVLSDCENGLSFGLILACMVVSKVFMSREIVCLFVLLLYSHANLMVFNPWNICFLCHEIVQKVEIPRTVVSNGRCLHKGFFPSERSLINYGSGQDADGCHQNNGIFRHFSLTRWSINMTFYIGKGLEIYYTKLTTWI